MRTTVPCRMRDVGGTERDQGALVTTRSPDQPPGVAPGRSAGSHYRPQLDGMRAVAVYLVVAFHAGISAFSGGFIGVDVFFVLSGYLVTQLLLRDFRTSGRVSFRRFYSRRFRRLLPAAFVALVVTAAVYTAVAAPADVHAALGGFRAAFLYVANWHFISQSNDYFAANVNTNPVVHFWSLAVEEQFYLCWPLLLSGIYLVSGRAGARRWKMVRVVIAAGFVISLVAALHLSTVNLSRAYYGTDTRAYELLAGALLAITPRIMKVAKRRRRAIQALAPLNVAILVLIATSTIHLGAIQRGVAATIATCGLIVALEVSRGGMVKRALSSPSAVYLGRISYGTYLWHWPVIVIATQRFQPNAVSLFALTCLVGTALASLSFELLEQRVRLSRRLDRQRTGVIAVGLATSLVGGLVIVPAILHHDTSGAATSTAVLGNTPSANDLRVRVPSGFDASAVLSESFGGRTCYDGAPVSQCIVVQGSHPKILLVGDSHALSLLPAFTGLARARHFTLAIATSPSCPWQQGLVEMPPDSPTDVPTVCHSHQDDLYNRIVPTFDPDLIVLVHHPLDDPHGASDLLAGDKTVHPFTAALQNAVQSASRRSLQKLTKPGRKIVIVEPIPIAPPVMNPLTCLSRATYLDDCRYVATNGFTPIEKFLASLANGTSVYTVSFDRLVCPYLPICDPIVRGVVVKRDPQHLTAAYSATLATPIARFLTADGVLPRTP
jgi:peptidoglycan/LPS O-acetylase OafA/YrhL